MILDDTGVTLGSTVLMTAALGSGLVGGVFFAFSVFVMRALASVPPPSGMLAMQAINRVVLNPVFLGTFLGTGVVAGWAAVDAVLTERATGAAWAVGGALVYWIGGIGVTAAANVPRNEALAKLSAETDMGQRYWQGYVKSWTRWNHVRTVSCSVALLFFLVALLRQAGR